MRGASFISTAGKISWDRDYEVTRVVRGKQGGCGSTEGKDERASMWGRELSTISNAAKRSR